MIPTLWARKMRLKDISVSQITQLLSGQVGTLGQMCQSLFARPELTTAQQKFKCSEREAGLVMRVMNYLLKPQAKYQAFCGFE